MRVHCKQCGNKPFNSISLLRKHQWAAHPKSYAAVGYSHKNGQELVKTVKVQMTASELLDKLKEQQRFMNDVVNLIERMINA
jgi:hypothetical protein